MALACACVTFADERAAHAEEPVIEGADGVIPCRAFEQKNDKELAAWAKQQGSTPYVYPREDTIFGAPWGAFLKSIGSNADLILATIVPHVGAQLRGDTPAAVVSWPLSVPFGPTFTCTRTQGTFDVKRHRPHRAVFEPGFVASNRGVGLFVRPGYRFILQPSDWVVGAGGGLGSTIEITGNREPARPSISPEVLIRFGHCCAPSYFTLAFRYDHYFGGEVRDIFGGSLGYVYF